MRKKSLQRLRKCAHSFEGFGRPVTRVFGSTWELATSTHSRYWLGIMHSIFQTLPFSCFSVSHLIPNHPNHASITAIETAAWGAAVHSEAVSRPDRPLDINSGFKRPALYCPAYTKETVERHLRFSCQIADECRHDSCVWDIAKDHKANHNLRPLCIPTDTTAKSTKLALSHIDRYHGIRLSDISAPASRSLCIRGKISITTQYFPTHNRARFRRRQRAFFSNGTDQIPMQAITLHHWRWKEAALPNSTEHYQRKSKYSRWKHIPSCHLCQQPVDGHVSPSISHRNIQSSSIFSRHHSSPVQSRGQLQKRNSSHGVGEHGNIHHLCWIPAFGQIRWHQQPDGYHYRVPEFCLCLLRCTHHCRWPSAGCLLQSIPCH